MKLLKLTQGKYAQVDDTDFDHLNQWKWYLKGGYATRQEHFGMVDGKQKQRTILLHRFIMREPIGLEIDHRDLDRLNCQRSNLRPATRKQNQANRPAQCNNTSGFKGVIWSKANKKWRANLTHMGKKIYLGYFNTPEEASDAYYLGAIKYHGEFARRF